MTGPEIFAVAVTWTLGLVWLLGLCRAAGKENRQ